MSNQYVRPATSLDLVRKQKYSTVLIPSHKRSHDDIELEPRPVNEACVVNNRLDSSSATIEHKRQRVDPVEKNRIEASEIFDVNSSIVLNAIVNEEAPRLASDPIPRSSLNPLLSLSHHRYGLPETLVRNFSSLGIKNIYPWQSSCLLGRGILADKKNLVYTAPTGGGKSLVADIIMLKRVIENPTQKAILVLPYVALVQEKLKWLRRLVEGVKKNSNLASQLSSQLPKWLKPHENSIRVVGFFGGSKTRATWSDVDVAVCTIEKANSLINTAIEQCTIHELSAVVFDELHMIDDDHRGYLMELMATKLLSVQCDIQIIGMSATLSNTQLLAKWLDAKYYMSQYKPVPIEEYLVYDQKIYPASTSIAIVKATTNNPNSIQLSATANPTRIVKASQFKELNNPLSNAVISLAIENVKAGFGTLIFCSARQRCQSIAMLLSQVMPAATNITDGVIYKRKDVINELRALSIGLDETLDKTIVKGVAFHHAGMTIEERTIVADAFDEGIISVIVATCSLAAGINLPARRVILHGARMGRDMIDPAMLRQMRGRAGRKGKDEIGESYLCCQKSDLEDVVQLLEAELPSVGSSLTPGKRGIKRALLEVIAVRLATHKDAIQDYIERTLLFQTIDCDSLADLVVLTIEDLITSGLIALDSTGSYAATLLGQAIVASSLTPEDGIFLHSELQRALQAFVMDGEMHIFYTFTPVHWSPGADINWSIFRREMERLDESGLRVLNFVGIKPAFVNKMANSTKLLPEANAEDVKLARIYRRFYTAFQLRDLCNEIPIHAVARKFEVPRGFVQTLAQTCEGFAAGMIQFCDRMGWGMLKSTLEHMCDRLKAGAKSDLLDLAKIPYVKSRTARIFWENGLKSLRIVAEAEPKDLLPLLLLAQPRRSKMEGHDETKYHQKLILKAEIIIGAANRLWDRQQMLDIENDI